MATYYQPLLTEDSFAVFKRWMGNRLFANSFSEWKWRQRRETTGRIGHLTMEIAVVPEEFLEFCLTGRLKIDEQSLDRFAYEKGIQTNSTGYTRIG